MATKDKIYRQVFKNSVTVQSSTAVTIKEMPAVTIQADKSVKLYVYMPIRKDKNDASTIILGTNIKVNGVWFCLGNSGLANNLCLLDSKVIGEYVHTKILPIDRLIKDCGVVAGSPYTLQVELTARTRLSKFLVNGSNDVNRTHRGQSGRNINFLSDQNYTTVLISEIS